jgi:hypothetical protein
MHERQQNLFWEYTPVRNTSVIPRNQTRAGCMPIGAASQPSARSFSQLLAIELGAASAIAPLAV